MTRPAAATAAAAKEPRFACEAPPVDVEELDEVVVALPPDAGVRGGAVVLVTLQHIISHRFMKQTRIFPSLT